MGSSPPPFSLPFALHRKDQTHTHPIQLPLHFSIGILMIVSVNFMVMEAMMVIITVVMMVTMIVFVITLLLIN